jgi:1-acyl-sn-glycerol-3-phosphate acyltransferase
MTVGVEKAIAKGFQIVIFPEGTRKALDAEPVYKYGIQHIYKTVNTPVLPVALNTGAFWPRKGFVHYPGTVIMEFMPPIEPGLDGDVFQVRLIDAIETASNALMREAASGPTPSPLAVEAVAKMDAGLNQLRPQVDGDELGQPGEIPR